MLKKIAILILIGFAGLAEAAETPKGGDLDKRIRFVDYNPNQVTQIIGALFTSTQIEFGADETVIHASVGDPVWEIAPSENLVFLKVREIHKPTNLQIVTERPDHTTRSYQIELGAMTPAQAAVSQPFYLIRYRYPGDEANRRKQAADAAVAERRASDVDTILARDEKNGPRNWQYSLQGEADFKPSEVYDNGKVTTIRFVGNVEMPAIYAVGADGKEELVPKSVNGDAVFVHMVAKRFVMRRGDAVMCIFNDAFVPGGIDPGTKTTSPEVARVAAATGSKKASNISRSAVDAPATLTGSTQVAPGSPAVIQPASTKR
jgi:type IV secretion system protein VirB9